MLSVLSIPCLLNFSQIHIDKKIFQVTSVTLKLIFLCSFAIFYFEHSETEANIHSLWDGFWWAIVTVGTVGYGDRYPVSVAGRLVGMLLIFPGVRLMLILTATIVSIFIERKLKKEKGLETVNVKDHIVICGWNQYSDGFCKD